MRMITSDAFGRWTGGVGILALAALAGALFVPGGAFWPVVLATGLVGSALATAVLVRSRAIPSLAEVIATAEIEPVVGATGREHTGGAILRPRGEGEP
jgi:hypothetical protein